MATIKEVLVRKTVFSAMRNPDNVKIYLDATKKMSSDAILYKDPNISTAFYALGTGCSEAINESKIKYDNAPTTGNHKLWLAAGTKAITWLTELTTQVEKIANDDANRETRIEAATNISLSYLTPQQLTKSKKGKPPIPELKLTSVASGSIDVEITNGAEYSPSQVTIIAVETLSGTTITLVGADLTIEYTGIGSAKIKVAAGKGSFTHFLDLKGGVEYDFYAFAQNGSKQVSKLSTKITLKA